MTTFGRAYWRAVYALNPLGWMIRGRYILPFHRCSRCRRWFSTRRRLYSDFCSHECVTGILFPIGVFYESP